MAKKFSFDQIVKEEHTKDIFAKVFDKMTIMALHSLAQKGYFDYLEHVISTGKEAHVFLAKDHAGNKRAVKIYKTLTTDFKHMRDYIEGDLRFKNVSGKKRELINQWTRKEFKNLEKLNRVGIRVPMPLAFKENVIVMEFIGGEKAAPQVKEKTPEDLEKFRDTIAKWLAVMVEKAMLVHADMSEYNTLNFEEEIVLIDCAQSVLTSHPKAEFFFNRDVKNLSNYITKKGLKTSPEELLERIRSFKEKI